MSPRAWYRPVPDRYVDATRGVMSVDAAAIDLDLARRQHGQMVEGLRWLGFDPIPIPAAHHLPDSVFVEDPAVLVGRRALICRSAHSVRGREAPSVAAALSEGGLKLVQMQAGATLDGGDVLRIGRRLWVSRSERTNAAGIDALRSAFPGCAVTEVTLPEGVLHLKCVCSRAAEDTVLVARGSLDAAVFEGLSVIEIPADEGYAANVVGRASKVLIAAGFPETAAACRATGLEIRALDLSEIRKGDGSITCLSLREPEI